MNACATRRFCLDLKYVITHFKLRSLQTETWDYDRFSRCSGSFSVSPLCQRRRMPNGTLHTLRNRQIKAKITFACDVQCVHISDAELELEWRAAFLEVWVEVEMYKHLTRFFLLLFSVFFDSTVSLFLFLLFVLFLLLHLLSTFCSFSCFIENLIKYSQSNDSKRIINEFVCLACTSKWFDLHWNFVYF